MLPRFYAPGLDPSTARTVLAADESHHLARVLRLGPGDAVAIFDGRGHEFLARVERVDRDAATVALVQPIAAAPEPAVRVTLVQAVLKGDKMDDVVRDATMAGVAHIAPIVTARTEIKVSALKRAHAGERWQRVAVASAKQCRRAWIPPTELAVPLESWLAAPFDGPRLLLVEPSAGEEGVLSMRQLQARARPEIRGVPCRARRRLDARGARGRAGGRLPARDPRPAHPARRCRRARCARGVERRLGQIKSRSGTTGSAKREAGSREARS